MLGGCRAGSSEGRSMDDRVEVEGPLDRARRDRGAETRQRLIRGALDVFGRYGFEGATTRQIAKAADANLAAIVYHFGGKEELHIAVAEHIVARIGDLIGPTLAMSNTATTMESPEAARRALLDILGTVVDVLLGTEEAELWARFIVREQMQPSGAFDIIYGFMGGAQSICCRLIARVIDRDPEEEEVKLRAFTMLGQVLVFRVAQSVVLRRMDWPGIDERKRERIKRIILEQVGLILDSGAIR